MHENEQHRPGLDALAISSQGTYGDRSAGCFAAGEAAERPQEDREN